MFSYLLRSSVPNCIWDGTGFWKLRFQKAVTTRILAQYFSLSHETEAKLLRATSAPGVTWDGACSRIVYAPPFQIVFGTEPAYGSSASMKLQQHNFSSIFSLGHEMEARLVLVTSVPRTVCDGEKNSDKYQSSACLKLPLFHIKVALSSVRTWMRLPLTFSCPRSVFHARVNRSNS